uniref:Hormone-sensitive lipase n=1 Tax=Ditylenchus dipsaci TaxID=166011 RepID=A0A915EKV5_9BILA
MDQKSTAKSVPKQKLGLELSVERQAVFTLLNQLSIDNEAYFLQCPSSTYATRIAECCHEISLSSVVIKDLVKQLQDVSRSYDYDEHTPGNGFRSLVCVSDILLLRLVSVLRACAESRTSRMFRISYYCKEIESFGAILRFLTLSFHQVIRMIPMLEPDSLFPPLNCEYGQFNNVLKGIESLDASCFYGRLLGFQFIPSVTRVFRIIGIILATYSLTWESRSAAIGSLINSGKMLLNPEQRAVRIIKVTREADIEFCRGFWNLSEFSSSKLFCATMALCETRDIIPSGPMQIEAVYGSLVSIPEPTAHTGVRPVQIKVLSVCHRVGLSPSNAANKLPASPYLLIHCHGGGYVATTSKSHETYLRAWAKSLNCPIVSIDYSLAPENPFPRATEEVLYAYAYILNNPEKLGWTGERVCMVGDSAGGNLIMSVNLRLVELNVKRLPDGIVPIYTPFLFQYLPSPSRILSFMDPLLHMGVVIRCAAAYTGSYSNEELDKNCYFNEKDRSPTKHKSLVEYVDQVQKAQRDHFLDFSQDSQSIVSLINLSQNKANSCLNLPDNQKGSVIKESSQETETSDLNRASSNESIYNKASSKNGAQQAANNDADADDLEEDETGTRSETQTVKINNLDGNPCHICLSSINFDENLIDYLQMHPITKRAVYRTTGNVLVNENEPMEEEQEITVLESAAVPERRSFRKSITTDGMSSIFSLYSSSSNQTASEQPVQNNKRKLSRNKGRSLSQSLAYTAALAAGHAFDNLSEWFDDTSKTPVGHADKQKLTRAVTLSAQQNAQMQIEEAEQHESHLTELLKLKLPRDYLMSPLYAPDELLKKLPPIRLVACHLDPLLDDTIIIDLLDSLPHGFLNFALMSTECRDGANLCLQRIKQALQMQD